jgi:hypothetical protein
MAKSDLIICSLELGKDQSCVGGCPKYVSFLFYIKRLCTKKTKLGKSILYNQQLKLKSYTSLA